MSFFGQPQQQQWTFNIPSTTQPATTSIFGQPSTSQQALSLFGGGNTNTNTNTTPNAGGGLFGGGTNTNTDPSTGPFGGGQQQGQPAAAGVFGNTQQNQPAAGGSLFGTPQQQQGQQPASGGLFGNNAANANAGGLAGAPTLPSLNTRGSSLFGGGGSTNALGTKLTESIFGQPAPAPAAIYSVPPPPMPTARRNPPAFGSSFGLGLGGQQQQQQPTNAFGASTLSTSALRPPGAAAGARAGAAGGQAADAQTQFGQGASFMCVLFLSLSLLPCLPPFREVDDLTYLPLPSAALLLPTFSFSPFLPLPFPSSLSPILGSYLSNKP
ncbi:hypothetical protein DFH08DRAFT_997318 [Mycena albidolilacea]|uniref:Uncharacterized protein n=1 Tax=Mycena albidolilacea TaxID=1033008 RepID=A0AAD7A6E2_9AGAR|nr:hypothetical protein DFH08DRAFT_997318 [Mycena albidolilacea]